MNRPWHAMGLAQKADTLVAALTPLANLVVAVLASVAFIKYLAGG